MTRQAEAKLLEFLTSNENLPFVVQILQQGKQIRKLFLSQFWTDLHRYLQENIPSIPELPASMEWVTPGDGEIDSKHTSLRYRNSGLAQRQYLSYAVYHERSGEGLHLSVCIVWEHDTSADSSPYALKSVKELEKRFVSADFKKGRWWFRHKEITQFASVEDFLASIITCEKDTLLRQIGDSFWSLVGETLNMVTKANEEIAGACRNS